MTAEYDLGLGAGFQFIQSIDNNTLTGANPVTIDTTGAASITLRFTTFGSYEAGGGGGDNAGVDTVNITFFNAVGSQIRRTASLAGATSATLSFNYTSANLAAGDTVVAEASNNSGGPFTTLATFDGGGTAAVSYDLTPYISANTTVRFRITSGFATNGTADVFSIDNVDIAYDAATRPQVQRTASLAGSTNASLGFSYSSANLVPGDTVVVEAGSSAAGPFTILATIDGGGAAAVSYPLTGYISANTTIRFRITSGFVTTSKTFSIDNVDIAYATFGAAGTQIQRTANLTGAANASLTFSYTSNNLVPGDTVLVEASNNAAGPFTTLATLDGGGSATVSYALTTFISAATTIRFRVTSGFAVLNDTFSIDNVERLVRDVLGSGHPDRSHGPARRRRPGSRADIHDSLCRPGRGRHGGSGGQQQRRRSIHDSRYLRRWHALRRAALRPDAVPSATTTIRFRVTGGFGGTGKTFSIDNVDVSYGVLSTFASANPPEFLSSSTGCRIRPGGTAVTLTFNATVVDPLPTGLTEITNTASTTSAQFPIAMSDSVTNIVVNPSVLSATVGDRVWLDADGDGSQDIGEPGIANVEVTLKDQWGTPVNVTITDVNGRYFFPGISAGPGYYVEVTATTLPSGVTQSFPVGFTNHRTTTFTLSDGQNYTAADLGYSPTAGTATFGDLVWVDADNDGVRDPGEIGRGGVTVRLHLDTNNNGVVDGAEVVVSTTTAPDGSYLFTGAVASGTQDYIVSVDPTQALLVGYTNTTPTSRSYPDVSSGGAYLDADFGFRGTGVTTYSIQDRVWFDTNGNGLFAGESGIGGVTMELLNASLQVIGTTTTAADGTFTFSGLAGGGADYTTRISDTVGILTNYFGTTSYAQARQRAESNLVGNLDRTAAPSYGFLASRSIGDTIFYDNSDNTNRARQDPAEVRGSVRELHACDRTPGR